MWNNKRYGIAATCTSRKNSRQAKSVGRRRIFRLKNLWDWFGVRTTTTEIFGSSISNIRNGQELQEEKGDSHGSNERRVSLTVILDSSWLINRSQIVDGRTWA